MKHWLMLAALICFGSMAAHADVEIADVANSSCAVRQVAVSSFTATVMDSADGTATTMSMPGRKVIEVQDDHATANLRCGFDSSVSTSKGRKIYAAGGYWILGLTSYDENSVQLHMRCINDSGSGPVTVPVTECRSK